MMKRFFFSCLTILLLGASHSKGQDSPVRNNIVSVIPVSTFTDMNWSFGAGYERRLWKKQKWGIKIPVYINFRQHLYGVDEGVEYAPHYQVNPGLYYYPLGQRKVQYAMGISALYTQGKRRVWDAIKNIDQHYTMQQGAVMLLQMIRFNATERLTLGMEIGGSYPVFYNYKNLTAQETLVAKKDYLLHIHFCIGYRF